MNRIKELLPKPWTFPYPDTELYTKEQLVFLAEQVVQECIKVCLEQRNPQNLNYKPSERFADELKLHFGMPR